MEREQEARESARSLVLSSRSHYQDGLASARGMDYTQMVQQQQIRREREESAAIAQAQRQEQEQLRSLLQAEMTEKLRQDLEQRRLLEEEQLYQRHAALDLNLHQNRQPPPQLPPLQIEQPFQRKKKYHGPLFAGLSDTVEDDARVSLDTTSAKEAPSKLESILAALFPFLQPTSPQVHTAPQLAVPPVQPPPAIVRDSASDNEEERAETAQRVSVQGAAFETWEQTPADMQAAIKADSTAVALTKLAVARKHRNGVKLQLIELRGARERMMREQAGMRHPAALQNGHLQGFSEEMRRLRELDDAAIENIHVISDMIVESEETLLELDRKITKLALKVEKSCLDRKHMSNSGAWAWNDVILHLEKLAFDDHDDHDDAGQDTARSLGASWEEPAASAGIYQEPNAVERQEELDLNILAREGAAEIAQDFAPLVHSLLAAGAAPEATEVSTALKAARRTFDELVRARANSALASESGEGLEGQGIGAERRRWNVARRSLIITAAVEKFWPSTEMALLAMGQMQLSHGHLRHPSSEQNGQGHGKRGRAEIDIRHAWMDKLDPQELAHDQEIEPKKEGREGGGEHERKVAGESMGVSMQDAPRTPSATPGALPTTTFSTRRSAKKDAWGAYGGDFDVSALRGGMDDTSLASPPQLEDEDESSLTPLDRAGAVRYSLSGIALTLK